MAKSNRTSEQAYADAQEVKKRFESGEPLMEVLKEVGMTPTVYYRNVKGIKKRAAKKATKKAAKRASKKASKKAAKRAYSRRPKFEQVAPERVSFQALDNPKGGKTMVIVTDDSGTVASILLAAFGRSAG